MDVTTSSEELDTSIESLTSTTIEGQTVDTSPQRPSPFSLRSQCASARCPHGTGILFRSRISPSPSKQRVKSRRRRRSDLHRHNTSGDSSSFLEISHDHGHEHGHLLHDREHVHHHHHHHDHEHYVPHDGIHNIDHHHVHVQNQQLHTPPRVRTPDQLTLGHVHTPLRKQAEVSFTEIPKEGGQSYLHSHEYPLTRADILFDEMQKEEERRRITRERTETTSETTTTTVRRGLIDPSSNGGPQVGVNGGSQVGVNGGVASIAESVKNTVIGFLTPQKEKSLSAIVESSESGFEDGSVIGDKRAAPGSNEPFRPARQFFDEKHTREHLNSDYFSGSDTPSRLRESTKRLSIRKPYNQYIAYSSDEEYDDWKEQPKSDYTYSASLTYRQRVTPDRKIGSPNMSRRTLKGGIFGYSATEFSTVDDASNSHTLDLRSRTVLKPMDALSDGSDGEEAPAQELNRSRSRRSTRSRSIDVPESNGSLTRTITHVSTEYTTTRTLHRGLDADSDVDDGTESAVPIRATPLLARGGTPLGRATTPLKTSNFTSTSSISMMNAGKGYSLREGTIAEDVEEDDEAEGGFFTRWSRKTVVCVTQITTIVAASVAMLATRAITASSSSSSSSSKEKIGLEEERTSVSTMELIKTKYNTTCEHLRKNPILIWIPLLLILLLLSLAAYWWLLQSHGKTAGASDPTENDGLLMTVYGFASWVYSGISSSLAALWLLTTSNCLWLISACQGGIIYIYESVAAMCTWLGTSTLSCLAWLWALTVSCFTLLLDLLYTVWEYVAYGGLGVYSLFSSSASYVYGLLPFVASNDSGLEADQEKSSFSFIAWVSNLSPMERLSETYVAIAEGTQSSGTMLWNAWLWLVLSMGEILSAMASYTLLGLSSIWAAILYVLTGLWTLLTIIWLALASILWTAATVVYSLVPSTSSTVSTGSATVSTSTVKTGIVQEIVQSSVANLSTTQIEEIVQQVLNREKLSIIAAAVAESSKGQLTLDDVSATANSLKISDAEHRSKILRLQEENTHLIKELGELGQRLYNVEGKIEVADQKDLQDNKEIEERIEQLVQQINKLEMDHANLAGDVKSCCDDKKLPALLADIFGITSNGTADIGAWLKNYFVAKEELTVKIDELMATMQVRTDDDTTQAAAAQTTQMIMGTVLSRLREEMTKQQQQLSAETQQQISAQVKAAAGILGEQVLEQVVQQVQMQNHQLKENLRETVTSEVQEHVSAAVEIAVSKAIESAVNTAVPHTVEQSVSETVKETLPGMVSEEVAASVTEIVASALPAAVTSAVAEAMIQLNERKANEETSEVKNDVKNEVVGVSTNITHESGSGSLFIPGMHLSGGLNETEVLKVVQDALRKYDADKTGMVDHALESAGGNIVSTRCTESYQVHQAELRVLGFPVYRYSTNNPRTVIQPDTMPGQCWAFKGSQGYIVIQLAGLVKPTGFTLEHIPKALSPTGDIDSAPREFEVWGLYTEWDEGVFLGTYEYVDNGDSLQYFPVMEENSEHFPLMELKINSNHGNLQYTCLYRFRVHGLRLLQ